MHGRLHTSVVTEKAGRRHECEAVGYIFKYDRYLYYNCELASSQAVVILALMAEGKPASDM